MYNKRKQRLPYAGTRKLPDEQRGIPHRKNINPQKYFNDDPMIQQGNEALSKTKLTRDPETAIRTTAKSLQETPFRNWSPDQIQDAQKYLNPQIVATIVKEQQSKKR